MNMKNSIKDIWREMDIQVSIFREVGRSVMVVEFFTSATGMFNLRYQSMRTASRAGLGRGGQSQTISFPLCWGWGEKN